MEPPVHVEGTRSFAIPVRHFCRRMKQGACQMAALAAKQTPWWHTFIPTADWQTLFTSATIGVNNAAAGTVDDNDVSDIKGDYNEQFWSALQPGGRQPPV
jgi:hypothetical protein